MENEIRNDGYIELERIFEKDGCTLIDLEEMPKYWIFEESTIGAFFSYQGEIWLFKPEFEFLKNASYIELVLEELAHDFGIPSAHYDLATLNGKKGIITKYFKQKDCQYTLGEELLEDYVYYGLKISQDDFFTLDSAVLTHNSLEGIWRALDYRYRNLKNRESIVWHLMSRLVDIFIFDILTHQEDRHSKNWGIVESKDKIDIQPIYDNELAFNNIKALPSLVSESLKEEELFHFSHYEHAVKDVLLEFLEVSGGRYLEKLQEKLPLIQNENIVSVLSRVENRIGCEIPQDVKSYIQNCFSNIVLETTETIKEYKESLKINH